MTVVLNTSLPSAPNNVSILKTVTDDITQERALSVANEFGVNGENIENLDNVWKVWNGSSEVWVYASGGIRYYTSEVFWGMHLREELPSESACKDIADLFLENLKSEGLLQTGLNATFEDVASDQKIIAHSDGTRENYIVNIHVNYSLSFNCVKLDGPGAKLRVYIGEGGEITGFIGNMWGLSEENIVNALTPEEAIELFKNGDYGASKAVINSIELVYYVPAPDVKTTQIIPVYKFEGEFTLIDGNTLGLVELVPAVQSTEIEDTNFW